MAEKAQAEAAAPASGGMAVDKAVAQNGMAQSNMAAPMPAEATSADGTASQTAAVTIVGNKAFVLKDGVWTDTSFDSSHMTTTQIPFPSDEFFDLINQTPELGQYFALGDRVIVVAENMVYETTVGDPSKLSAPVPNTPTANTPEPAPIEPTPTNESSQIPVEPTATMPAQSHVTDEINLNLMADVVEGVAPLQVNLTSELSGGADNNRDYYCAKSRFEFGDGISRENSPSCPAWTESSQIERHFQTSYSYHEPGTYQATFHLGDRAAQNITIVVKPANKESSQNSPNTPVKIVNSVNPTSTSTPSNCLLGLLFPMSGLVMSVIKKVSK
jgi:hypothetical protein